MAGHYHDHGQSHEHGSGHDHTHGASERAMGMAAALTGLFMLAEVAGGLISGSLALLADAGHMLTDFAALLLAFVGFRLARRPADWKRSYGFGRFRVLAAFVNGIALFAIAVWIVGEAIHRLISPGPVMGGVMLGIAIVGLVVNLLAFRILSGGGDDLNARAAVLHVIGDLLGSVAAIVAAAIIMLTGWVAADPLLSVLVAVLILHSAWKVVSESGRILLEAAPPGLDARQIRSDLSNGVAGVRRVEHLHLWSITEDRPMATLEAELSPDAEPRATCHAIKARLRERFGIDHATVEILPPPAPRPGGG